MEFTISILNPCGRDRCWGAYHPGLWTDERGIRVVRPYLLSAFAFTRQLYMRGDHPLGFTQIHFMSFALRRLYPCSCCYCSCICQSCRARSKAEGPGLLSGIFYLFGLTTSLRLGSYQREVVCSFWPGLLQIHGLTEQAFGSNNSCPSAYVTTVSVSIVCPDRALSGGYRERI